MAFDSMSADAVDLLSGRKVNIRNPSAFVGGKYSLHIAPPKRYVGVAVGGFG